MEKNNYKKTKGHWLKTEGCIDSMEEFHFIKNNFPMPQEENNQIEIFCEVLKKIKSKNPVMIELGTSGTESSFYSLLFEKWFDYM